MYLGKRILLTRQLFLWLSSPHIRQYGLWEPAGSLLGNGPTLGPLEYAIFFSTLNLSEFVGFYRSLGGLATPKLTTQRIP